MPYQLYLKFDVLNEFVCAGTLITLKYAVSAYHCFNSQWLISVYSVHAGRYIRNDEYNSSFHEEGEQVGEYYILLICKTRNLDLWSWF